MGIDLCLLPIDAEGIVNYSHQIITVPRDRSLYDAIEKLPALPVPKRFFTFMGRAKDGEHGYRDTQKTPYGQRLLATTFGHLKTINIPGPAGAFIAASPDHQRVALFWH